MVFRFQSSWSHLFYRKNSRCVCACDREKRSPRIENESKCDVSRHRGETTASRWKKQKKPSQFLEVAFDLKQALNMFSGFFLQVHKKQKMRIRNVSILKKDIG